VTTEAIAGRIGIPPLALERLLEEELARDHVRREQIANAPVELVERDGRVLRRLPS
jgi:hypothetical protein